MQPSNRSTYSPWRQDYRRETVAAQADGWRCAVTGAVPPPITIGATYARTGDYALPAGMAYLRDQGSPLVEQAESVLHRLEGGTDALLFSSGMAAATAVFATLPAGSRVVVPETMYFGLTRWLREFGPQLGLVVAAAPTGDLDAVRAAVRAAPTALVWVESPCNPTWVVTDVAACAEIAHEAGALLGVDNTVPTPVHTQPFELGADLIMHSATKYLNGHTDVVGGFLATSTENEHWARLRLHRQLGGAVPGQLETYLLVRGMKTLFPRMRQISASAQRIAEHFVEHPVIRRVAYPGLPGDPGHAVAARQMRDGFSGMLSLHVDGPGDLALRVARNCELFLAATSLGGVESLIEHRHTFEGPGSTAPPDMLRLSIGLEDPDDLIADLEQALKRAAVDEAPRLEDHR
ncbi:PLP-dependent transferase [Solihabitans fulvus]|uniref:PLP-dependent transferase n=1 Tax=Solihabitans fulvus TaxID=1892852 RepID=A0A5B2WMQ7_9PSEU|nr:PLP-dependent aspartate aminotransferase family protein [Solihabitans fulvus]KAA2252715.1 PLP-dependent transferase [Solihabitans fulvus]